MVIIVFIWSCLWGSLTNERTGQAYPIWWDTVLCTTWTTLKRQWKMLIKTSLCNGEDKLLKHRDKYNWVISYTFSVLHQITSLQSIRVKNFFGLEVVFTSIFYNLNLSSIERQAKESLNPVHSFCKQKKPFRVINWAINNKDLKTTF